MGTKRRRNLFVCREVEEEVGLDQCFRCDVVEGDILVSEAGEVTCFDLWCGIREGGLPNLLSVYLIFEAVRGVSGICTVGYPTWAISECTWFFRFEFTSIKFQSLCLQLARELFDSYQLGLGIGLLVLACDTTPLGS